MKALIKLSLIISLGAFIIGSTAFLLSTLSLTSAITENTVMKGDTQASITATLIDEVRDYDTLLAESDRLSDKKIYKSNVFTEGNLPLAVSYSGSDMLQTETLDTQKIQELVEYNVRSYVGDISRLKSIKFEVITNATFTKQVRSGTAYAEGFNHTSLNLTEYDVDTLLITNSTDRTLKPKTETFRFFIDEVDGWYTDNISQPTFAEVEDWKYDWRELKSLSSLELSKDNKFFLNIRGKIKPFTEPFAVDVYPTIKIGTIQFDFPEFAWWIDTTCNVRYPILSNVTTGGIPFAVNDTNITGDVIWTENSTIQGELTYAYYGDVNFAAPFCGIANETDEKNWHNETAFTNNNSVVYDTSSTPAVYHFSENVGGTSVDSTENTNDLTLDAVSWVPGMWGSALNATFATAPDDDSLDITGTMAIAMWIHPYTFDSNQAVTMLVQKGVDDCENYNFGIRTGTTNALSFLSGTDCDFNPGSIAVETGRWQHVAMVFDGTHVYYYINGTAAGSAATSLDAANAEILNIGRRQVNGFVFDGAVDEVRIYNRTLSAAEIREMVSNSPLYDNISALGPEERNIAADELSGRDAIEDGIRTSILGSNAVIYTDQKVYTRYLNTSQQNATFDKFTLNGTKRWAINYVTTGENFTNMQNITPSLYILEMENMTNSNIKVSVSGFINETNSG